MLIISGEEEKEREWGLAKGVKRMPSTPVSVSLSHTHTPLRRPKSNLAKY